MHQSTNVFQCHCGKTPAHKKMFKGLNAFFKILSTISSALWWFAKKAKEFKSLSIDPQTINSSTKQIVVFPLTWKLILTKITETKIFTFHKFYFFTKKILKRTAVPLTHNIPVFMMELQKKN